MPTPAGTLEAPVNSQPCNACWHWVTPLQPPFTGRKTPHGVALYFHEWLVWHLHVVGHQRLDVAIGAA